MKTWLKRILIGIVAFFASVIVMQLGHFIIRSFYLKFIGRNLLGATGEFWFIGFSLIVLILSFIFSIFIAWKGKKAAVIILIGLILFSLVLLVASGIKDYQKESKYLSEQKDLFTKLDNSIVEIAENPDKKICLFDFDAEGFWDETNLQGAYESGINDCSKVSCVDSIAYPSFYLHSNLKSFFYDSKEEMEKAYDGAIMVRRKEFFLFDMVEDSKIGNLEILNSEEKDWEKRIFLVLDYTDKYYFNKTSHTTSRDNLMIQFADSGCATGIYIENQGMNSEGLPILFIYKF